MDRNGVLALFNRPLPLTPMRTLLCLALALLAVPLAAAQDGDSRTPFQADLDRLDREIQALDREARADARADLDGIVADYDDLRTTYGGDAVSDPVAADRATEDYTERYDQIAGRVYRARLDAASNRNAYARVASDRVDLYDEQIADLRTRYDAATGDDRAEYARDVIALRRQRDAYRTEAFRARRADFDSATRRRTTDRLAGIDAEFRTARRDAMGRMDGNMDPMDGGMN